MTEIDILERLRGDVPSILAMRDGAGEIEWLRDKVKRLQARIGELEKQHETPVDDMPSLGDGGPQ